jgi:hypothetical protein
MELDGFKSAWQKQTLETKGPVDPGGISRSLRFLRTSAIRDVERSDEITRIVFCLLFALLAIGVSFAVMTPGVSRIGAWILAAALIIDGVGGIILLACRWRKPATASIAEFIARERDQMKMRAGFDRFSQGLIVLLASATLLLLIFSPHPVNPRENALDTLQRMVIVTSFLAIAWRRTKSHAREVSLELERYLKDLEGH